MPDKCSSLRAAENSTKISTSHKISFSRSLRNKSIFLAATPATFQYTTTKGSPAMVLSLPSFGSALD